MNVLHLVAAVCKHAWMPATLMLMTLHAAAVPCKKLGYLLVLGCKYCITWSHTVTY